MIRAVIEEILLFLIPFGLFALYLVARRRNPLRWAHWSSGSFWLVMIGLGLAALSFVVAGVTSVRHTTGYAPAHMENGRLVPGEFR